MGYFIKRAFDKNTGKEVKFPDKVKDATGKEFYFRWPESLDEVCVSETDGKDIDKIGLRNGKPEEYGLIVKEVEMPNGYHFAVYTYTMPDDDVHRVEPYNVKFHGFVEIFTKEKVTKDVEAEIADAAIHYALLKEKAARQELLDILDRRRCSGCCLSSKPIGVESGCCAIKVNVIPHTNYNFDWTIGDKSLIGLIKQNYGLFREQVSRGNFRTAYPINLDEEGEEL